MEDEPIEHRLPRGGVQITLGIAGRASAMLVSTDGVMEGGLHNNPISPQLIDEPAQPGKQRRRYWHRAGVPQSIVRTKSKSPLQ